MSWATEDWTLGLSGHVAQKVKELQVHQERLSRENKQKQLQIDNIYTSLEKQNAKNEEVRVELQSVQRELQMVQDEAKAAVNSRERLSQELQTKQAQVCSLEGQLDAARTLNSKLSQEVKRLEAELEKLQNSICSTDTTPFSTPCWSATSPWENNGNRKEERTGYRDEGNNRTHNSRQRLQFSDCSPQPLKNTPLRHPSDQSESFSTPLAAFPWERDDSKPATRRRSPISSQMPCTDVIVQVHPEQGAFGKEKGLCKETDASVTALQASMAALKEELSSKAALIKSIQNEMAQSKKELAAKEISVQRARDELNLAHTRMAQENERASGAEQRLKQLQEELKCQRQNAESSRLQHQQRTKDLEKQHQRDLTELHKERQCLEKQHQQEVNKLNQELQQARTLHNGLQAQADKLSLQKQTLEKELDTLKEKQKWTEGQLQESQKKEAQTQAKLMAAVREAEGVAVSLEQSRKKERALEEEGRRLAEELADTLRLVKELQEQKAAPAPVIQPVQFCSVGQSFSSPTSQALNARLLTQIKPAVEQKRELKRRVEISSSYPSDREPGEGIDSEHIAALIPPDCDTLQREGHNRNIEEKDQNKVMHNNKSDTISSFDYDTPTSILIDQDQGSLLYSAEKAPALISDRAIVFEDIKKENAALRSELRDAHEEIQKRLDDLESQRRAEAEARTRVKQLSRKLASQSTEKKEQDEKWREKVEREKTETEKLRKTITALEMEVKKGREADEENERQEVQEDKKYKALEDRESEMVELNFQLKKQLSEVKAQLALEREEKKREEEEKTQLTNTIIDEKNELNMKLEELKAELEKLKHSTNDSEAEEKLTVSSSPLLYLTLHDDELNSNNLPSPEQHLLFCQSTNQRNALVSQATAPLIQEQQTVIDPEVSPQVASDVPSTKQNSSVNYSAPSDLENVVERLQKENVKETERANYYQLKLEALQSQVTYQTQQLTTEFEKQSQYIVCLLAELQQKDSAFLRLEAELQHCKQEFELFKSQREKEENNMTFEGDGQPKLMGQEESSLETFGLHHSEEKQGTVTCDHDRLTPISGKETSGSDDQHARPVKVDKTQRSHDREEVEFSQGRATADLAAELPALQQDHQPLQKNISDMNNSVNDSYLTHTERKQQEEKHQDKLQNYSPISAAQPCLAEPRSPPRLHDITAKDDLQVERSCDKEQGDLEREDEGIEGELKAACDPEINRLQEQVVELHTKLRALSAVARQQAEELTLWRLTSQPPPLFDLSNTENQFVNQDQISGVNQSQSDQYQTEEGLTLGVLESHGKVTVARTDELLLSCSSNKLQGYMLNSSVEQSNIPETQSLPHLEMIQSLQKYNQDENDKESESEDLELSNSCQHKEDSALQVSFERTSPQHLTRDSGPERTKLFNLESPEDTPDAPSLTSEITTKDSSDRAFRIGRRSVGSQTEDSFGPHAPPTASQLQCVYTQTTEEDEDEDVCVESPPVSPPAWGPEAGNQVLFSGSFPIPADPARLAERIRRNRTQLSAAFDDTEYEPYGLPEVVMKGFADIPSGPSCPYIVRRGLLGTTVVPVDQKIQDQEETD